MISWFIFTCLFFYCSETHKMALPYQARHSRIVRRSQKFNHFTTWFWRCPGNFWTMGQLGEWVWKTTTGMCSPLFCILNERSLSLWSSVISNLTNCYFLGYWTASLKRNTDWRGQETTSRGSFYSTLGTFQILVLGCATYFIYNHEELRSGSSLNLPRKIKWSKNTNRWKHAN